MIVPVRITIHSKGIKTVLKLIFEAAIMLKIMAASPHTYSSRFSQNGAFLIFLIVGIIAKASIMAKSISNQLKGITFKIDSVVGTTMKKAIVLRNLTEIGCCLINLMPFKPKKKQNIVVTTVEVAAQPPWLLKIMIASINEIVAQIKQVGELG